MREENRILTASGARQAWWLQAPTGGVHDLPKLGSLKAELYVLVDGQAEAESKHRRLV